MVKRLRRPGGPERIIAPTHLFFSLTHKETYMKKPLLAAAIIGNVVLLLKLNERVSRIEYRLGIALLPQPKTTNNDLPENSLVAR